MSDWVEVSTKGALMEIKLNRPEKKNALTQDMYAEMTRALIQAEQANDKIAAVIISSAGDVFCAGNDLAGLLTPWRAHHEFS